MIIKQLDEYQRKFKNRFFVKKDCTIISSIIIVFCGVSSVMYSALVFHNNIFDRMRYMTFDGTMFTTLVSFLFIVISTFEKIYDTEVTNRFIYFMRLSSATTEFVIFIVVMIGLLPFLPDKPDIVTYPGALMHLVIPLTSILCFLFNDAPIGKLKVYEPLFGTTYITIYAVVITILFATGILPSSKAPYSFLDFKNRPFWFSLLCLIVIYTIGYLISKAFIRLNSKLSWQWFKNIKVGKQKASG